jgi:hypothetical protein
MNELFERWLDARLSVPGMIACCVAPANEEGAFRTTDEKFSVEKMAQILNLVRNIRELPGAGPAPVRWHTWIFANGKVRAVTRPDGWTFAAAVRTNSDAAQILDPLAEEFIALKPTVLTEPVAA